MFLNEVGMIIKNNGFQQGFSLAMEQIKEYPRCGKLKQNLALILEGGMFTTLTDDESKQYGLGLYLQSFFMGISCGH